MSKALLPANIASFKKPRLCASNSNISLIGKTVYIKRCNAKTHFTEDGKCICHLVKQSLKIANEHIHYDGSVSFEIIVNGRSFFLERGEFLQLRQLQLFLKGNISLVS